MSKYLFAIQDANGREVCSWKGDVGKVSDVTTTHSEGVATIEVAGIGEVGSGETGDSTPPLTLYRWPADDKLADPVTHVVAE